MTQSVKGMPLRSIKVIAAEVEATWLPQVDYTARPYLDAMKTLDKITDSYYADTGFAVVSYFLANTSKWRGEDARRIKAELKDILKSAK